MSPSQLDFLWCVRILDNCLQKSLWAKLLLISKIYQMQYLHRSRFTICFTFNYERLVIFIWPRFDLKKQFICRRLLYNLWRTLNWKERGLNKLLDRWLNSQSFDKPLYKLEHVLNMNVVYIFWNNVISRCFVELREMIIFSKIRKC